MDFFFKSDHHQHHNIGAAVMFIFTRLYVTLWQNLLFLKFPLLTFISYKGNCLMFVSIFFIVIKQISV